MSRASLMRAGFWFAALLITGVSYERAAGAQAWVDPAGSLSTSVDYEFSPSSAVVETPDRSFDGEPITAHMISLGAEYVPIDRLGLQVSLPLLAVKYGGDGMPFPQHGSYDDGSFHTTLTDVRLNARYELLRDIIAFTPQIGVSVPVKKYEHVGFANAGRGLKQLHMGASIGRTLEPVVPNLFFQAQYEFSLVEKFDDTATPEQAAVTKTFGQNRSDVSFLVGYFLLGGDLTIDLGLNWRIAHGGMTFEDLPNDPMATLYIYHDPLLKEEFLLVGGDVGYNITDRLSINATTRLFVRGSNTRDANIFGLGLTFAIL